MSDSFRYQGRLPRLWQRIGAQINQNGVMGPGAPMAQPPQGLNTGGLSTAARHDWSSFDEFKRMNQELQAARHPAPIASGPVAPSPHVTDGRTWPTRIATNAVNAAVAPVHVASPATPAPHASEFARPAALPFDRTGQAVQRGPSGDVSSITYDPTKDATSNVQRQNDAQTGSFRNTMVIDPKYAVKGREIAVGTNNPDNFIAKSEFDRRSNLPENAGEDADPMAVDREMDAAARKGAFAGSSASAAPIRQNPTVSTPQTEARLPVADQTTPAPDRNAGERASAESDAAPGGFSEGPYAGLNKGQIRAKRYDEAEAANPMSAPNLTKRINESLTPPNLSRIIPPLVGPKADEFRRKQQATAAVN